MGFISKDQELKYTIECTGEGFKKLKVKICAFSSIGHTPITKRVGAYVDLLSSETYEVDSWWDAQLIANKTFKDVKFSDMVTFEIEGYWNQNLRIGHGNK